MDHANPEAHRSMLQGLVNSLGRDDVGVGDVVEEEGNVHFTLAKAEHTLRAELPVEVLADVELARSAMMGILARMHKVAPTMPVQ